MLRRMGWSYDENSPKRDPMVPVEHDLPDREPLPWRHKLVRLWRFLRSR